MKTNALLVMNESLALDSSSFIVASVHPLSLTSRRR
jgi:hypothetical protein